MTVMKKISNWLWNIPCNLIGFILYIICKIKNRQTFKYNDAIVTVYEIGSGISLGKYIFIPIWATFDEKERDEYVRHEYGHTLQAKELGILYFVIILIPSMIWNGCFEWYRQKYNKSYYSFYTEKWADKLGGVKR